MGAIPWSPLARGFLTRPFNAATATIRGRTDNRIDNYGVTEGNKQVVERIEELAKRKDVTMAQIAVAWVLTKDGMFKRWIGDVLSES